MSQYLTARSVVYAVAALALLALAAQQLALVGDFRIDDAYITFSFSKNLAAGEGPVYSHGVRVEGYSNFLWMLFIALGYLFAPSVDPYVPARIFGFAFLLGGLYVTYRLTRRRAPAWAGLLAVALVLVSSDVFRATLSGLETVPFMAALAFGWLVYLEEPRERRRWSLLAFLPAALMRIDGFGPMLVVIAFELASSVASRRFSLARFARWLAPAALVWAAYFAWRYAYYGLLLPTTYYAKNMVTAGEADRGWNQLWGFLRDYGALALLPFFVFALARGPRRDALALTGAVLAQVVYSAVVGGDWMPFQRFFLPVLPLAAVLAAWGASALREELRAYTLEVRLAALAVAAAAFGLVGVRAHMGSVDTAEERGKLGEAAHVARHTHKNLLASVDLAAYVVRRPGDKLVTDYAGVFAVYTDAAVIDMWGLCNTDIALNGGINGINPIYGKECAECYARLGPDYFHVTIPLVRGPDAFQSSRQIIDAVFQGHAIDRVIGLSANFAAGRVVQQGSGRTFWFLERRRSGLPLVPRRPAPGIVVDYPFERG